MDAMLDYLAQDRRRALAGGAVLPPRAHGSVVFADISGWTPLTTQLTRALGPRRGIEELTLRLNRVYDLLVAEVDRQGGSVVAFAGDGITCWFAGDSGARAIACALAMQSALQARDLARLPDAAPAGPPGFSAALTLRAAIASGELGRFVVGDPAIQRLDLLAGAVLNRLGRIEALAGQHEVVVDGATLEGLAQAGGQPGAPPVSEWRIEPHSGIRVGVLAPGAPWPGAEPWDRGAGEAGTSPAEPLSAECIRPWLIPAVFNHLSSGQGEFLTELRPAAALFVRFSGIDYENDPQAHAKLDRYVRRAQAIVQRYDGTLFSLNTDAVGNVLYAAFGIPAAHQDDAMRAVAAAYELRQAAAESDDIAGLQIGIEQGVVRAGAYGAAHRRTYGALGDEVNLAARLMAQAAPGEILAGGGVQAATASIYRWHPLPPRQIKGKDAAVEIFRLDSVREQPILDLHEPTYALPMVGRAAELALIGEKLARAAGGPLGSRGQIVGITAEAGMGKSRLLAEAIQLAEQQGWTVYGGPCQSYGTNTPYLVWQPIWRAFFGLAWDIAPAEQQRQLAAALEAIDPALLRRLPLLGVVLNLPLPDNELTGGLDAATRKKSLEALLVACLRARATQRAAAPASRIMLVLEDCHWIDPLSHDLLERVSRAISHLPVVIIAVYRPFDLERLQAPRITALAHFSEIRLAELAQPEARSLIDAMLKQAARTLPAALIDRLVERSQGIPFYLEELIHYIAEQPVALASIELPASLHSLILSRVDMLSDQQKITIKVASIIGRLFRAGWLWGYYPSLGSPAEVLADLGTLSRLDITPLEIPEPEPIYLFKHAITHEVVYESMPYATRSDLHEQFAAFLERGPQSDQSLPLLAFHYSQTNNLAKRRLYNRRAGDAAQAAAAHATALEYYAAVLPLLEEPEEQAAVRFEMGGICDIIGHWGEAIGFYDEILAMVEAGAIDRAWRVRCLHVRSKVLHREGEYEQALAGLAEAEAASHGAAERGFRADVLTEVGLVKWRQGLLDASQAALELALELAQAVGDRPVLSRIYNALGNLFYSKGELESALGFQGKSFALREELGDRRGMSTSLINLGMGAINGGDLEGGRRSFEQALEVVQEIGDARGVSICLLNIATVDYRLGAFEPALRGYRQSIAIGRDIGDRLLLSYGLVGIGAVAGARNQEGDAALAIGSLAAASANTAALGAVLEPYEQGMVDQALAAIKERMDPGAFAAAWEAGLAQPFHAALAAALGEDAPA